MNRLNSYDEYKNIVNTFKRSHKGYFTNNYFMPDRIERYIELNRAYYYISENALILYFDEEHFYRLCVFADSDNDFIIPKMDKKLYLRITFKNSIPSDRQSAFESKLCSLGFENVGTSVKIQGDLKELSDKLIKYDTFKKRLDDKGYRFEYATPDLYSKCEEMLLSSNIIKDYHLDYMTESEKNELIPGSYMYISDASGNICGASMCNIVGDVCEGFGIAIKDEYRLLGLAPLLAAIRFKWALNNGAQSTEGWVLLSNTTSIEYHKSMGYTFMNKYANEWLLM